MPKPQARLPLSLSLLSFRRALLLLLTALVLVQTLGVLHRVAHAHGTHSAVTAEPATSVASSQDLMAGLQRLWGDHSHAVDCQLFDQNCPDALHTPACVLMPILPAYSWLTATLRERFALFERFYAARGPPAVLL
jgi:hypothetical protein